MGPPDPSNAIIPMNFGIAAAFDQRDFPLAYYLQEGNFNKGRFLMRATLDELKNLWELGIDFEKNEDFKAGTKEGIQESVLIYGPHISIDVSVV